MLKAEIKNRINWLRPPLNDAKTFLVIFYVVGAIGMLVPLTFPFFKFLIPFALLLNTGLLAWFYPEKIKLKTLIAFLAIFIIGLTVEIAGVQTGAIFGSYSYGQSLGLKVLNTPIIIGLNWLLLVYTSAAMLNRFKLQTWLRVLLATLSMLIYDLVLEQVAPDIDMWQWTFNSVPYQNYIAWFLLALAFHSMLAILKIKPQNALATRVFVLQLLFFVVLLIFLKFVF